MSTIETTTARSVFADTAEALFARYRARIEFTGKLLGGVPKNPKVIEGWIRSKLVEVPDDEIRMLAAKTAREMGVDLPEGIAPEEEDRILDRIASEMSGEIQTNGFKRDEQGLYIEERQVKAAIKEAVNIHFGKRAKWGPTGKGPKNFTAEAVIVQPDRIHLDRFEPDGVELCIGHINGPQGPKSTLTNFEYVERAVIDLEVWVANDAVPAEAWPLVWTQIEWFGLGAQRSQGYGKNTVTRWDRSD